MYQQDSPNDAVVRVGYGGAGIDPNLDIDAWSARLADLVPAVDDAGRIDQIRTLENIKAACAAAQARITAEFVASQRNSSPLAAINAEDCLSRGAGVGGKSPSQVAARRRAQAARLANRSAAAQVALARRESPHRGGRYVGLADALVHEMPGVLGALQAGVINEWRATIIVRETACLSREQRRQVDAELAGRLDGLGDARIEALVTGIAQRLDALAATRRAAQAAHDRRVSLRPKPDVMGFLGGLLPMASAVACFAALGRAADANPGGDGRTRDQRMADEFVARLTGSVGSAEPARTTPGSAAPALTTPGSAASDFDRGDACSATRIARLDGVDTAVPAAPLGDPTARRCAHIQDPVEAVRAAYRQAVDRRAVERQSASRPVDAVGAAATVTAESLGSPVPPVCPGYPVCPGDLCPPEPPPTSAPPNGPGPHGFPPAAAVEINLVITDRTLFGERDDPAVFPGNLPVPAPLARAMITSLPPEANVWIRRLYTRPETGELLAMDERRRTFSPLMRRLLFTRDGTCRTPWCDAPARHADHLHPFARGGPTAIRNGQSLSEDCNYLRSAPGWAAARDADGSGAITVTTPTGHAYRSPVPDLVPGHTAPVVDIRYGAERIVEVLLGRAG